MSKKKLAFISIFAAIIVVGIILPYVTGSWFKSKVDDYIKATNKQFAKPVVVLSQYHQGLWHSHFVMASRKSKESYQIDLNFGPLVWLNLRQAQFSTIKIQQQGKASALTTAYINWHFQLILNKLIKSSTKAGDSNPFSINYTHTVNLLKPQQQRIVLKFHNFGLQPQSINNSRVKHLTVVMTPSPLKDKQHVLDLSVNFDKFTLQDNVRNVSTNVKNINVKHLLLVLHDDLFAQFNKVIWDPNSLARFMANFYSPKAIIIDHKTAFSIKDGHVAVPYLHGTFDVNAQWPSLAKSIDIPVQRLSSLLVDNMSLINKLRQLAPGIQYHYHVNINPLFVNKLMPYIHIKNTMLDGSKQSLAIKSSGLSINRHALAQVAGLTWDGLFAKNGINLKNLNVNIKANKELAHLQVNLDKLEVGHIKRKHVQLDLTIADYLHANKVIRNYLLFGKKPINFYDMLPKTIHVDNLSLETPQGLIKWQLQMKRVIKSSANNSVDKFPYTIHVSSTLPTDYVKKFSEVKNNKILSPYSLSHKIYISHAEYLTPKSALFLQMTAGSRSFMRYMIYRNYIQFDKPSTHYEVEYNPITNKVMINQHAVGQQDQLFITSLFTKSMNHAALQKVNNSNKSDDVAYLNAINQALSLPTKPLKQENITLLRSLANKGYGQAISDMCNLPIMLQFNYDKADLAHDCQQAYQQGNKYVDLITVETFLKNRTGNVTLHDLKTAQGYLRKPKDMRFPFENLQAVFMFDKYPKATNFVFPYIIQALDTTTSETVFALAQREIYKLLPYFSSSQLLAIANKFNLSNYDEAKEVAYVYAILSEVRGNNAASELRKKIQHSMAPLERARAIENFYILRGSLEKKGFAKKKLIYILMQVQKQTATIPDDYDLSDYTADNKFDFTPSQAKEVYALLANMYKQGIGVDVNHSMAEKWLLKAKHIELKDKGLHT